MTTIEVLEKNIEDIQLRLHEHWKILQVMRKGGGEKVTANCSFQCRHQQILRKTLLEAIQVLEESRKAFKSRQLEALRKKLIVVLAETE